MYWRNMDMHDLAIELFCRFDPDQKGYITQDQLLNSSVKDNFLSEGQIISVFALLDKEEKGIITLSDFTDAFVDVSVNENEIIQTPVCIDGGYATFSNENINENKSDCDTPPNGYANRTNGNVTSKGNCECPCSKTHNCQSKMKVRCCMFDKSLKNLKNSRSFDSLDETPRSVRPDTPRYARRHFGLRKASFTRRGSLPSLVMGRRLESLPNLLKTKRWKSYDYGINKCFVTVNEEENNNSTYEICNGDNRTLPGNDTLCSRHSLESSGCFYSDTSSGGRNSVTKELDEIFGTDNESVSKTGCAQCNLNRTKSKSNSVSVLPNNVFMENGRVGNSVTSIPTNSPNSVNGGGLEQIYLDINSKLSPYFEVEDRTKINIYNGTPPTPSKKNGYITTGKQIFDSQEKENAGGTDNMIVLNSRLRYLKETMFDEEWENYLRRIGGVSLFSGNQTLQYLWQQIKLYQGDLLFIFDKFLKNVIEEHKIAYYKCQETENTLNLKIEQHEKEVGSLYEEFDLSREKEIKQLERKQHEREEYLKIEFRKIIDYKEQAYQECCKQMADISERLEHYEEDMSNLHAGKRKAEDQCRFLLQEQQRYLAENRLFMQENELIKQKYKSCAKTLAHLQEHYNQMKNVAEEERGKHRSVVQRYNDVLDEKTFLETSVANLSMENKDLRDQNRSLVPLEDKINASIELSHFPILTSSPVANKYLKKLNCNYQAMSLHEEINSSFGEFENNSNCNDYKTKSDDANCDNSGNNSNYEKNGDSMNNYNYNDNGLACSTSNNSATRTSLDVNKNSTCNSSNSLLSALEEASKVHERDRGNSTKQSDVKSDNIREECFNITHHFIECEKLSIRANTSAEESSIMNKSVWSGYDPLHNTNLVVDAGREMNKSRHLKEKYIRLAAPFQSEFKVIFCGDSNVGKTSLIYRICFNGFRDSLNEDTKAVDTFLKNVETGGQNFRLKIWDTVGQERYNSIPHSYYRKSDVAVIVCDTTQEVSFLNMKTWLDTVHQHSEDMVVIILGNKIDLSTSRTVLKQKGEIFAKENRAVYLEASAKSGENIEKLLYLITTKLLDQNEFVLIQNYFEQSFVTRSPMKKTCCN